MSAQRISKARCYYGPCGGEVLIGRGAMAGFGRCQRCAVIMGRTGNRWRVLTQEEWATLGRGLAVEMFGRQKMRVEIRAPMSARRRRAS